MALSSNVVNAGDDVLASQYNNLRSDLSDGDVGALNRYFEAHIYSFRGLTSTDDATIEIDASPDFYFVNADGGFAQRAYVAGMPHISSGNTITQFTLVYARDDADGGVQLDLTLSRFARSDNTKVDMALCQGSDTTGNIVTKDDDSIVSGLIDNSLYKYHCFMLITNNNAKTDTKVYSIRIKVNCVNTLQ